jgi:hypothetical protein
MCELTIVAAVHLVGVGCRFGGIAAAALHAAWPTAVQHLHFVDLWWLNMYTFCCCLLPYSSCCKCEYLLSKFFVSEV